MNTERDEDYVKSATAWLAEMELNIQQASNSLDFHVKELDLHNKHIEVLKAQLEHDAKRLEKQRAEFEKYLEDTK